MTNHTYDPHEHEPLPEGEEKAPPLTKTMGLVRWGILAAMGVFALVMLLSYFDLAPWSGGETGGVQYHCPMHPTYISSQPGDCPICGMSLVPMKNSADTVAVDAAHPMTPDTLQAKNRYACPMHPEVVSDTPSQCPKCGMNLELIAMSARPEAAPGKFTCPMHPEIVSDTMGRCPECNMFLEQVTDAGVTSGVPGLVPVTLESQRVQLIGVRTGTAEMRTVTQSSSYPGTITADESKIAKISVRTEGWIQKLYVNKTGEEVKQGETLFTLYSQDLYQAEQDYLSALNSTKQTGSDPFLVETRKQLVEAAKQRLNLLGLAENEISQLEKNGKASTEVPIHSPITGIVIEKNVTQGQAIMSDQSLFTVADLRQIWVLVDVYESDLADVEIGQDAAITLSAFPGDQFHGSVAFVYPTVSELTRTAQVRLHFQNPLLKLKPGMFAEVQLGSSGDPVLTVAREALMENGDRDYLFVVHGGTHFEPRLVTVGAKSDELVEILSGLSEGETVVTSANFLIDSESRLKAAIAGMGNTTNEHAGHGK